VAAGVGVLGLAMGFVVGRISAADPAPEPDIAVVPSPAPPPVVLQQPPEDLDSCKQQLALAIGLLDAADRARVGMPAGFAEDLPAQYTPDGFRSAVEAALAACPGSGLALAKVDCGEFPCLAYFSQPTGTVGRGLDALKACPAWSDAFGAGETATGSFMTDAGVKEYSLAMPRPPGSTGDGAARQRFRARREDGEAALMRAWDGRELTELEKIDQSIAFFGAQDDPKSRAIVEKLREERKALAGR
jgi:hypothetical protein